MTTTRRASLIAGLLYLITFVSIPTLTLYGPVRSADFLSGVGSDGAVRLGAILEVVVALAGIGTAVALYPVIRRYQPQLALGFLASRTLEASMIFTGVVSLLSVVGLRAGSAGADSRSLVAPAHLLIGQYDLAFLLGQSLMPGINALLLGSLLYRARLVPRVLPLIGLVGAPLHLTAVVLTLTGTVDRISPVTMLAVVPVAVWELSLGVYLVVKGLAPGTDRGLLHLPGPVLDILPPAPVAPAPVAPAPL